MIILKCCAVLEAGTLLLCLQARARQQEKGRQRAAGRRHYAPVAIISSVAVSK